MFFYSFTDTLDSTKTYTIMVSKFYPPHWNLHEYFTRLRHSNLTYFLKLLPYPLGYYDYEEHHRRTELTWNWTDALKCLPKHSPLIQLLKATHKFPNLGECAKIISSPIQRWISLWTIQSLSEIWTANTHLTKLTILACSCSYPSDFIIFRFSTKF